LSALTSSFPEIARVKFTDRGGERDVSVRVLQGLGTASKYLTPNKIRELWLEYSKHDVLFSDYTRGKVEPFITSILNPRSFWFELFDNESSRPIGIASITDIIPKYDAKGHFAFWDRIGSGREKLIWTLMDICFQEFDLHRMSAEIPAYQRGTIRSTKRLGFSQEGEKKESIFHKGAWMNTIIFGITVDEFKEVTNVGYPIRGREVRNSDRDQEGNEEHSELDQSAPDEGDRSISEHGIAELDEPAGV